MMNDKETSQATITELMKRQAAVENNDSAFFKQPKVVKNDAHSSSENKDSVEIKDRLRDLNMLVAGSQLGPEYNDEYRRIKRPLLSNAFGKTAQLVDKGNLILVTSSIPGEGITHTAINLALSIAQERDHTVLLIDCDVAKRGTSRMLGIADKPGLIDVLESDEVGIGDVLLRTDVPELCLVPAGKGHDFVTELLASKTMSELVSEIGERYNDRVIIFDGPPLLPTTETQILTGLVGQVVFVIEAGKTSQSLVEEALKLIPEDQATGLVMNKSESMFGRGGYYYGYYGSEEKKE